MDPFYRQKEYAKITCLFLRSLNSWLNLCQAGVRHPFHICLIKKLQGLDNYILRHQINYRWFLGSWSNPEAVLRKPSIPFRVKVIIAARFVIHYIQTRISRHFLKNGKCPYSPYKAAGRRSLSSPESILTRRANFTGNLDVLKLWCCEVLHEWIPTHKDTKGRNFLTTEAWWCSSSDVIMHKTLFI